MAQLIVPKGNKHMSVRINIYHPGALDKPYSSKYHTGITNPFKCLKCQHLRKKMNEAASTFPDGLSKVLWMRKQIT